MRVSSFAVARPSYYDRNAAGSVLLYNANTVAPHGLTVRFTTTVASGKKAQVEAFMVSTWRDAAAGVASTRLMTGTVTVSGNTANLVTAITQSNTTYSQQTDRIAGPITLYAGETLEASTLDVSTGGTTAYWASAKLTTFDA